LVMVGWRRLLRGIRKNTGS